MRHVSKVVAASLILTATNIAAGEALAAPERYGRWDNAWGARPPAPPMHWKKAGDWYRHVRACQTRFVTYNPRTDTYTLRGVARRCGL